MNIYFTLPEIGDLTLEHEFYVLGEEPILFVCRDREDRRYLCSCCHIGDEWLIGQVHEEALIDLIDDRTSIRDVFMTGCEKLFFVLWDGEQFHLKFDFPDDALPKAGAFLDLEEERAGVFRKELEKSVRLKKPEKTVFAPNQGMEIQLRLRSYTQMLQMLQQLQSNDAQVLTSVVHTEVLSSSTQLFRGSIEYKLTLNILSLQKICDCVSQSCDQLSRPCKPEPHMTMVVEYGVKADSTYEKVCESDEIYPYAA